MTSDERVSATVEQLRKQTGDTQGDIAQVLGISQAAVSAKLNGRAGWNMRDLDKLGRHYGVSFLATPEALLAPVLASLSEGPRYVNRRQPNGFLGAA